MLLEETFRGFISNLKNLYLRPGGVVVGKRSKKHTKTIFRIIKFVKIMWKRGGDGLEAIIINPIIMHSWTIKFNNILLYHIRDIQDINNFLKFVLYFTLQPLPNFLPLNSNLDKDLIGDAIMVVEFVNTFGSLLGFEQDFDGDVTLGRCTN